MSKAIKHTLKSAAVTFTQSAKLDKDKDKFNTIFLLSFGTFLEYFDCAIRKSLKSVKKKEIDRYYSDG